MFAFMATSCQDRSLELLVLVFVMVTDTKLTPTNTEMLNHMEMTQDLELTGPH